MKLNLHNLERRRLAITGFEPAEANSIATTLAQAGALARVVAPDQNLSGRVNPYAHFDVCVLNCVKSDSGSSTADQILRSHSSVLLIGEAEAVAQELPEIAGVENEFILHPLRPEELLLRADRLIASVEAKLRATGAELRARGADQYRVLIADDEEAAGVMIAAILKHAGFECKIARDGLQAIEMAQKNRPDVVLLDVAMPKLDGFGTLAALRKMPETQGVPVIIVTGTAQGENDIVRGLQLGAQDYIHKPFNSREMVARVDRVLRNAESRRAA
jgi:CheY-like chemotaxis protein